MRLSQWGWIDIQADVKAPMTFDDGVSNQFSNNYSEINRQSSHPKSALICD